MRHIEFERLLDRATAILTRNMCASTAYHDPHEFERHVQDVLCAVVQDSGFTVTPTFHPHAFPDIRVNGFGVEVKYTKRDTWLAVGNSVFEGMRDRDVRDIYVIFGKTGGTPEVRWSRYEDAITHIRVSKSPRFVLELDGVRSTLFSHMNVTSCPLTSPVCR